MMDVIEDFCLLTEELLTNLRQIKAENRDQVIVRIQELLNSREELLPMIKPPFSKEDEVKGKRLINQQQELDLLLIKLKKDIQKDINGLSKKKTSMKRYINPYENMQTDGYFYDKRK